MKKHLGFLMLATVMMTMASCGSWREVAYFQDKDNISNVATPTPQTVTLQAGDKIAILVKCEDEETSELFNLAYTPKLIGNTGSYKSTQGMLGYTIDANGDIIFPSIGKMNVLGKTRAQVAEMVKTELEAQGQAKNPVVTVEFLDLTVSVLGEVKNPGRFNIDRDIFTVLDAIGMAGDLTIDGVRQNVMVMRTENGKQNIYTLNLCEAQQVLSSPAYYLRQNDIVYVQPTTKKARTATVNGNNVFSASFWLSVASTTVTVLTFIYAYASKK